MATLYDAQTGQPVEVPDAEALPALQSGRFGLPRGARVPVISPDGQAGDIDAAELPDALGRLGFRLEAADATRARQMEAEYGDSDVAAALAGAGRGLTLGLSDVALTKTGLVKPETLRGLQEANPVSSGVGEMLGSVAPAFIPGGQAAPAGAVARLGARVAAGAGTRLGGTAAARVAGAAVGGALEGSLFGLGSAVTEATLGDTDLTAQKLLAGAGLGALAGATGGALGEGLGLGLRRVVSGPAPEAAAAAPASAAPDMVAQLADEATKPGSGVRLKGFVEKHADSVRGLMEELELRVPDADEWTLRSLDLTGSQVAKLEDKDLAQLAPTLLRRDARYAGAKTMDKRLDLVRTMQAEAGDAIGKTSKEFDALAEAGEAPSIESIVQRVKDDVLKPLEDKPVWGGKRLTEEEAKHAAKGHGHPDMTPLGQLREHVKRLESLAGEPYSFARAEELKRSYDPFLKWDSMTESPLRDAYRSIRGIINGEIEAKAAAVATRAGRDDVFQAWKAAKTQYGAMAELEKLAAKRAAAGKGNRFFSLTDNIAGAAGFAAGGGLNPVGLAMSGAAALVNKWGRERLPQILALHFENASQGAGKRAASGFKEAVDNLLKKAPAAADATGAVDGAFGAYTPLLAGASARGAAALFAMHAALSESGDDGYQQQMQRAGFVPDMMVDAGAQKRARTLDAVEAAAQKAEARMDAAVAGFFQGGAKAAPRPPPLGTASRKERLAALEATRERLASLAANPEALQAALASATADMGDDAPATAAALMTTAARAVAFLDGKAPKPPAGPMQLPALAQTWQPSDESVARFERYAAAVDNPGGVLDDMAAGRVTREAVESLQAVYPALYEDMKTRVLDALASATTPLDYRQRLSVGLLLGAPTTPDMAPASVALRQQTFAGPKPQQGPGAPRGGSGGTVNLSTTTASASDALLSRRSA